MLGVDGADLDHRGGQQPLDVAHRADEALALRRVSGSSSDARSRRRGGRARPARPGPRRSRARGRGGRARRLDAEHAVALERAQQPASVARVELEPGPQRAHLAAVLPDLPQHARLGQRPAAREVVVVERADALGHRAVEAPDLLDHRLGHYLTLVRGSRESKTLQTPAACRPRAGPSSSRCCRRRSGPGVGPGAARARGRAGRRRSWPARCWPRCTTPRWSRTGSASRSARWCSRSR